MRGGRVESVADLHREVDEAVARLLAALPPLRCAPTCCGCCVDELTVFEVEAEWISERYSGRLQGSPAPRGRCALLDEAGRCRVYDRRPYVCRTQGLPLRWIGDDDDDDGLVERRDLCQLNDDRLALLELDRELCWELGPFEGRLATAQAMRDGGELRRVPLRQLARALATV